MMKNEYNNKLKAFLMEFLQTAMSGDGSFRMERYNGKGGTLYYLFIQMRVGQGKYVYARSGFNRDDVYLNFNPSFKLAAIITDGAAYFLGESVFDSTRYWCQEEWEELNSSLRETTGESHFACCLFDTWYNEFCENNKKDLLIPCYNALEPLPELDEDLTYDCRVEARYAVVYDKQGKYLSDFEFEKPSRENVAQMLCGIDAPYLQERKKYLEDNTEAMREHKACNAYAQQLVDSNVGFENWELELIRALRDVKDSIKASVTFSIDGKEATGKITPKAILRCISRNYPIFSNDFCSHKEGDSVLLSLRSWSNVRLTHKHIVKITHGQNTIYERKD